MRLYNIEYSDNSLYNSLKYDLMVPYSGFNSKEEAVLAAKLRFGGLETILDNFLLGNMGMQKIDSVSFDPAKYMKRRYEHQTNSGYSALLLIVPSSENAEGVHLIITHNQKQTVPRDFFYTVAEYLKSINTTTSLIVQEATNRIVSRIRMDSPDAQTTNIPTNTSSQTLDESFFQKYLANELTN